MIHSCRKIKVCSKRESGGVDKPNDEEKEGPEKITRSKQSLCKLEKIESEDNNRTFEMNKEQCYM